jgi:hypothetical protein
MDKPTQPDLLDSVEKYEMYIVMMVSWQEVKGSTNKPDEVRYMIKYYEEVEEVTGWEDDGDLSISYHFEPVTRGDFATREEAQKYLDSKLRFFNKYNGHPATVIESFYERKETIIEVFSSEAAAKKFCDIPEYEDLNLYILPVTGYSSPEIRGVYRRKMGRDKLISVMDRNKQADKYLNLQRNN